MTKYQRMRRRNLIARCVEGPEDPEPVDEVARQAKENVASQVGLWVAYHRGKTTHW